MVLDENDADALYVISPIGTSADRIYGISDAPGY
jgi:hypothetical protein